VLFLEIHTEEELKYLSAKDFRSCISSWASEHSSETVRTNAAALQNHSATIHEAKYRRNKIKQAMGQSLALLKDLHRANGEATDESDSEVRQIIVFLC
jgi:cytochrome c1